MEEVENVSKPEDASLSARRRRRLEKIEIPEGDVSISDEVLGKGGFGWVYLADYGGRNAAAKARCGWRMHHVTLSVLVLWMFSCILCKTKVSTHVPIRFAFPRKILFFRRLDVRVIAWLAGMLVFFVNSRGRRSYYCR